MNDLQLGSEVWFIPLSQKQPRQGVVLSIYENDRITPSTQLQCIRSGEYYVVPKSWIGDTQKSAKCNRINNDIDFRKCVNEMITSKGEKNE